MNAPVPPKAAPSPPLRRSDELNGGCVCVTLDRRVLARTLDSEVGAPGFANGLAEAHPWLFAHSPLFVPAATLRRMGQVVAAVEAAARLPRYRQAVLAWASPLAHADFGPAGVLMGYDFHLTEAGPKLIEVNTNAGGAFLNSLLARAQRTCCASAGVAADTPSHADFQARVAAMFREEWRRQGRSGPLRRVAILDDLPEAQPLFPEFRLAQALLASQGIETLIGDPRDLEFDGTEVRLQGVPVDLVYNRLVDFALEEASHQVLRRAYEAGRLVVTPNPHNYAVLADKRNLTLLSDPERLRGLGLEPASVGVLQSVVPQTVLVTPQNAAALWTDRRQWFFKPARGHASKAAYRGDKLTRRVWDEIQRAPYVAQAFAPPSVRRLRHQGEAVELKVDVRLYTYAGQVLLAAARLYRGQTTNLRTPGGGFAPVLVVADDAR